MSFVHLHNHSHYSILEWLPKPASYAKKAKELWMPAVAITDTSNVHACHELYKSCKSEGNKAILWTEIYVKSSLDENLNHKLVLLAKSLNWYRNIISLVSKANLDNYSKSPFIDFEDILDIKKQKWDLEMICLSWPISWEIPYYVLTWKSDEVIYDRIKDYISLFWEENYFLELMYHDDIPKQKIVTDKLIELHKKYDLKVVATNNCYYIEKEDKKTQDIIQALWTGHEIENPDRPTIVNWDYSFLSEEEMQVLFWFIPEALENTVKIAEMVDIQIETWWILIPTFELPEEHQKIYEKALCLEKDENSIKKLTSSEWYLRYLSFKWLNWRFDYWLDEKTIFEFIKKLDKPWLDKKLQETSPQELKDLSLTYYTKSKIDILDKLDKEKQDYIERLEYELVVIHEMWFDAYFLIVADYINWARNQNIPVWPGRWSAAWSLMAYLSGITDLDPLNYDLLFERFLNPARVSMPDIDTDFSDKERDKVVDYCRQKYWQDHVAQICTFGTFAARAAVKDVWRVMWIPFWEMNELAKLIPEKPWTKLQKALDESLEFKNAYNENKKYRDIIDNALKIEWNVRQLGVHACAVIIAPEPMTNFTALQHPPKDINAIVTQYSAYPLEDLWLLKMDFLGLRNLTIIKRALQIIKNNKNIDIDMSNLDMNDKKVFEVFSAWDTTWVFQFESDGMRKYLKDLKPNTFEDLIAMVSLYRPWPLAYIPAYIDRKYWREEIKYLTQDLKNILEEKWYSEEEINKEKEKLELDLKKILDVSYGIAVYQEQLMFIVQYMAWFSLWEADLLRRWVWKKKIDVIEKLKKEFITKAESYKWYKPETSRYIYEEMIQPAANYSFNKSHAACYAFIAYQTAYLKAHFPTEFLTSVMVSDEENMERVVLEVWEAESKSINILPPSVNESLKHFTYIDDKNIRFGLKAIKWIGDWPIDKIISSRNSLESKKFVSLENFIETCSKEVINKKSLEALIMSGSLDDLWLRKQMFESIEHMIKYCRRDENKKETNQIWLFDNSLEFEDKLELVETDTYRFEEKLKWEKEMIGFSVSWHALDWLWRYCHRRSRNIRKLKITLPELLELDKKENPEKYDKEEQELIKKEMWIEREENNIKTKKQNKIEKKDEIVQAVWVILDIRKIITKTGKQMIFLKCEWFDYDFEVVVFPKDVEKYQDKLEEDKIIIINWSLSINFEYGRKSIQARDIKIATISQVREQAKDMWLFDDKKRFKNIDLNKVEKDEETEENIIMQEEDSLEDMTTENRKEENSFEQDLEDKIEINRAEVEEQIMEEEYIIQIPKMAKKQDLYDLKEFLSTLKSWYIKVFLDLRWQIIDTKISLLEVDAVKKWEEEKWG